MTKILVVDDEVDLETLICQKFRQKIREHVYDFIFADNGLDALEKIQSQMDIDIVLCDINMPEMDGLTLLSKIGERHPLLKTVMVSAYGDMENIRQAMNCGAFDFITKPVNFEDLEATIEKTIKQVIQIKNSIKAIKENDILKMYVDKNVLSFMASREFETTFTDNLLIEATAVFIDVCGFTSISERETPDKVVKLLNSYFDVIVKEIIMQNGIIDKFIGDCVMAVFKDAYHLDRAIEACIAIKNNINNLPDEGYFSPKVSIGINSGEMISGNIGSVSLRRLDFTVIGDAVNISQRLQCAAMVGQIVISENCYNMVKRSFKCDKIGSITLKNKSKEMVVYEVIS